MKAILLEITCIRPAKNGPGFIAIAFNVDGKASSTRAWGKTEAEALHELRRLVEPERTMRLAQRRYLTHAGSIP